MVVARDRERDSVVLPPGASEPEKSEMSEFNCKPLMILRILRGDWKGTWFGELTGGKGVNAAIRGDLSPDCNSGALMEGADERQWPL
jgi:hypothetical protein